MASPSVQQLHRTSDIFAGNVILRRYVVQVFEFFEIMAWSHIGILPTVFVPFFYVSLMFSLLSCYSLL